MHFIRCIMPNKNKRCDKLEKDLVLHQLNTSCVISYIQFIRYGYPKRVPIQRIMDECEANKLTKTYINRSNFCKKIFTVIGLGFDDYKIGGDVIFIRANKFNLLEQFFLDVTAAKSLNNLETTIPGKIRKPK